MFESQEPQKLCIVNFSGNVGKSTFGRQVLAPRFTGATYVALETINTDNQAGENEQALSGEQLEELMEIAVMSDRVIVDVGASNVERFIARLEEFEGTHALFDLFLVPAVPDEKQITDTIKTISTLRALGIPGEKIRLIFNKMTPRHKFPDSFGLLLDAIQGTGVVYEPPVVFQQTDLYAKLNKETKETVLAVANDPTDFDKARRSSPNANERVRLVHLYLKKSQAQGINREHERAFAILFPVLASERAA